MAWGQAARSLPPGTPAAPSGKSPWLREAAGEPGRPEERPRPRVSSRSHLQSRCWLQRGPGEGRDRRGAGDVVTVSLKRSLEVPFGFPSEGGQSQELGDGQERGDTETQGQRAGRDRDPESQSGDRRGGERWVPALGSERPRPCAHARPTPARTEVSWGRGRAGSSKASRETGRGHRDLRD